jgi:hypothetical protein
MPAPSSRVVDEYMAPVHPLGTLRGRDAFYYMYRCAWLAYDKLDFRETVVQVCVVVVGGCSVVGNAYM